jgi:hypothetical protein
MEMFWIKNLFQFQAMLEFGGGGAAVAPVPYNPAMDEAAEQRRLDTERAVLADSKARGRASTIVAGRAIAAEEQQERGLLARKRRGAASQEMLG